MKSVVLCFSGGLDSSVLLRKLQKEDYTVRCLSINYGQRHGIELTKAAKLAQLFGCEHRIADLSSCKQFMGGSSQTSNIPVPEGHYEEASMKATVVPNRNMLFLAVAGAWAVSTKSEGVAYAAHSGDHAIYPDCRPEFTEAMEDALRLCDWHPVKLLRPFLYPQPFDKSDIVKLGHEMYFPFQMTYSCYKGGDYHCGKCGTCVERREAFEKAGVPDPTIYLTDHRKEE
jgi:7-cyano-7-deazaguanine synthase